MDGKAVSNQTIASVADRSAAFKIAYNRPPKLVVVFAGDNAASASYVSNKEKACNKAGMEFTLIRMSEKVTTREIVDEIHRLNQDDSVDGILVQMPLPDGVEESRIIQAILPEKDADGFHPLNIGFVWAGTYSIAPCTPSGIIRILEAYAFPFSGSHAVIVGRSNIVGKPMAALLLEKHCTVTLTHSRTRNLSAVCRQADLLVAAIGRPAMITSEFIRPGAYVVDVGINRITMETAPEFLRTDSSPCVRSLREKGHCLVGDVDPISGPQAASFLTPVPGGIGPMTVAMLIANTMTLAESRMAGNR